MRIAVSERSAYELYLTRTIKNATIIRAPVTGTILERKAEKGELITAQFASGAEGGPQGSVVALADLNDLQVELDIAQADFARLKAKQKGVVTVDAFPGKTFPASITRVDLGSNLSAQSSTTTTTLCPDADGDGIADAPAFGDDLALPQEFRGFVAADHGVDDVSFANQPNAAHLSLRELDVTTFVSHGSLGAGERPRRAARMNGHAATSAALRRRPEPTLRP